MKHGPFILVTCSPNILQQNYAGVVAPGDLQGAYVNDVRAVILDHRLEKDVRAPIERACAESRTPLFRWDLPETGLDPAEFEDAILEFLQEQNQWENVLPSNDTRARVETDTMVDIITTANSLLEPKEVMRTVLNHIHGVIACEAWSVLILDNNAENTLSFAVSHGPGQEQLALASLKVPFGKGIAGWVAKHRQPVIVNNAKEDPRFLPEIDKDTGFVTRNLLCAPLVSRGRTIGVIEMLNRENEVGFTEQELELVQVLVNPAAVAIENAYLFQKAQRLTIQDDLTKLFNSRHLNHCLESELKSARRQQTPLGLIFLDLDGFKGVNDNYGHLVGSRALVDIADIIAQICRPRDIAGRYGGDEFMIIMPETTPDDAFMMAECIRDGIAAYRINEMGMTASIGLACYPTHGDDREQLMRMADKAMYKVKEKGKNGILTADKL